VNRHGDELVIADANFPATSIAEAKSKVRLIRCDGHSGPAVLEAILTLFPVDTYVPAPVSLLRVIFFSCLS
jgi:L-fucose mutarotase